MNITTSPPTIAAKVSQSRSFMTLYMPSGTARPFLPDAVMPKRLSGRKGKKTVIGGNSEGECHEEDTCIVGGPVRHCRRARRRRRNSEGRGRPARVLEQHLHRCRAQAGLFQGGRARH